MNEHNFVFQNSTKVYFGNHQMDKLPQELAQFGKRVLLVYGGGSIKRSGLYSQIRELLSGFELFDLAGVEPNPRHTTVNRGAALCREHSIDVVLAIGGGSSIDCAKGVAATALAKTDDAWDLVERKVPYTEALPIAVVLTLAATGSEMNAGAVISNMDKNVKSGIGGECVRPRVAFENPELTFTVPAYQTACGSVDIIDHVLDTAYFNRKGQMDLLQRMQEQLMATVVTWAPIALAQPANYEARANLMWASSWALNGFVSEHLGQATAIHAMEHELSAYYDITHGHGIAILLPRWLAYVLEQDPAHTAPQIARFGVAVLGTTPTDDPVAGARTAIDALSTFLYQTLGLASTLTEVGIDDANLAIMAEAACRGGVLESFTTLTPEDVEKIYHMCL